LFEIVKPKPVPPNFLVVELSSCEKALKIFVWFSFKIPIPESSTAKRIVVLELAVLSIEISSFTNPFL
jgi:hypothetical protein